MMGIAFFVLLLFFLPTSVSDSSATTPASSDSDFPRFIIVIVIPAIIVPLIIALREDRAESTAKTKKAKRKPQYIHDASGESLEVVDDEDEISSRLS
jgi:hypothetical protein